MALKTCAIQQLTVRKTTCESLHFSNRLSTEFT